ncbi:MAG: 50S ribosomal protein L20 [Candidatus Colwellbacteria bacterium RIFCSPLOWO2_12_FULL_44_13]|uniref:Large ribosomal subunit protein bL20 n=3 Tax=Candidatus Colwelliibacteriota TaxID=1817904 RepID=A0A1G1Z6I8_9BACT|nr:MAG: 50S ribosomal protein L20 [Candidatus Colwellbacteria bacterium RIFCSPHIGHO2_12_FULL_44_17]OGY60242.1 MAG: 50S ribosomal protein L20 [Candidatus Colwellbacteria bacterium RIFCSPLOWO2_02_FULL_44_20b]OGY62050.1 MAG: 50S ribosomal protein L20 [Candidatus Colwellbacteria bacterium RIFCSPLOWO2_12_FULL_44_13]
MTRVKRGTLSVKKRRKILKYTKGYRWGRKSKVRAAHEALIHAWTHAFQGRKQKKRDYRRLWTTKINAAVRLEGMKYSTFIKALKDKDIQLDRKILADLAEHEPATFKALLKSLS